LKTARFVGARADRQRAAGDLAARALRLPVITTVGSVIEGVDAAGTACFARGRCCASAAKPRPAVARMAKRAAEAVRRLIMACSWKGCGIRWSGL